MSTISLRLPDELKQRVVRAAEELGISPHAFMVNAIYQSTNAIEQRAAFMKQAHHARAEMLQDGSGYVAEEVQLYLRQRLVDGQARRPGKTPWRK